MNDTRREDASITNISPDNHGVVVSVSTGANSTVTQCKHEHQTRIGNSALVKCLQCGKCRYDRSLERNR